MSIFQVALSLFLVLNPLGNIPLFVGLLSKYPIKKQKSIIIREMIFVLFIVILFSLFGKQMLSS
ncbi:MAG: MarC family protein, partial [Rhabdochlamydiaceae bacterium]